MYPQIQQDVSVFCTGLHILGQDLFSEANAMTYIECLELSQNYCQDHVFKEL